MDGCGGRDRLLSMVSEAASCSDADTSFQMQHLDSSQSTLATPSDAFATPSDPFAEATDADGGRCALCDARLGKRRLNPRHRCRLCNSTVCGTCSPSSVPLKGQQGLHRACTACLSNLEGTKEAAHRAGRLAGRLRGIVSGEAGSLPAKVPSMLESLALCEQTAGMLEQEIDAGKVAQARASRLAAETNAAEVACRHLGSRLLALGGQFFTGEARPGSLARSIALCESATGALEHAQERSGTACATGRTTSAAEFCISTPPLTAGSAAGTLDPDAESDSIQWITESEVSNSSVSRISLCRSELPEAHRRCCSLKCLGALAVCLAVPVVLALALLHWLLGSFLQNQLDQAPFSLQIVQMSSYGNDSLQVGISVSRSFLGVPGASLTCFNATIGANGSDLGWIMFPDIDLQFAVREDMLLNSTLHVYNATPPTSSQWTIMGNPHLQIAGMAIRLHLRTAFELPAWKLQEVQLSNLDIVAGNASMLHARIDASFLSSGSAEVIFGETSFALHALGDEEIELGRIVLPQLQVARGYNDLRNASLILHKSAENEPWLSDFFGRWASGHKQKVAIRGPLHSLASILDDRTLHLAELSGSPKGLVRSGFVSGAASLKGYHRRTGAACNLLTEQHCLRGAVVVLQNNVHHELQLLNISLDVDIRDDLEYRALLHELFVPRISYCHTGQRLARVRAQVGMWSHLDPSRAKDASVTLPAPAQGAEAALASLFLPGEPQPGQSNGTQCFPGQDPPIDCCFATVLSAAACFYQQQELSFIPVSVKGNMSIVVDDFQLQIKIFQSGIPITFEDDVPNVAAGPVHMACSDFNFARQRSGALVI
eukprot:TRINITY_DN96192_c0_g1_i1.p1 TRINITY_DN96192_c0_g1~~TRINITY_DN96192_c0_g1_i1.p1  ORF type:complete len:829 (+),score=135.16 TRINITY_DN96192_c0_g1_i1:33-2519(+)